jgi:hypothetical protein
VAPNAGSPPPSTDGCRDARRGSRRRCNERGWRRGRGAPPCPRRYGTEPPTVRAMTTVILMYGPAHGRTLTTEATDGEGTDGSSRPGGAVGSRALPRWFYRR